MVSRRLAAKTFKDFVIGRKLLSPEGCDDWLASVNNEPEGMYAHGDVGVSEHAVYIS